MKLRLLRLPFCILALAGWLLPACLSAAALTAAFDAANKLYEEGKYGEAATAYEKLIASGHISDAIYFNLGNACYKAGQNGRAIAAYRHAEQLAPRDPGLRFNLQFLRNKVNGNDNVPGQWWQHWLARLSLNEWTLLTTIAVWTWLLFLALTQWRQELKRTLRSCINIFGTASGFLAVCLAAMLYNYYTNQPAIVIAREAVVRNGPLDESQSAYSVQDGMELTVLDQKDDWLQVSDARQRIGWLKKTEVLVLKPNV
jgi:tetratricopeptide (TPR) repeat protein